MLYLLMMIFGTPTFSQQVCPVAKVILDTDIGGDIDDAFALVLAINSPELEVVGVCIENSIDGRGKIAQKILHLAHRDDIPVVEGLPVPGWGREPPPQLRWATDYTETKPYLSGAVDFIINKVKEYPDEITLVCYGPLTNVAAALQKNPEVKNMVKEIVLMGGVVSSSSVEFNIESDPQAAKIVFDSSAPITMVGLDVTSRVKLQKQNIEKIRATHTPLTDALFSLYKLWAGLIPTLHDPLAVGVAIDETFVKTFPSHIDVDNKGRTKVVRNLSPNARVCLRVDEKRFIDFFMDRIIKFEGQ